MSSRLEGRSLIIGLLAGVAMTAAVGFAVYQWSQPVSPGVASPATTEAARTIQAVQLSTSEQEKIGLATEAVLQESAIAEIVTVGRIDTGGRVTAAVFSTDIEGIRPGITAEITSGTSPEVKLAGTVESIDATSNPQTQTTAVRIRLGSPSALLRPGMFVRTTIQVPLAPDTLTVPRNAVIDTGGSKIVYVARGEGVFESRTIEVGRPLGPKYSVARGLASGDRVVTNGAFLVDSQTRLTGGMTGLFGGSKSFNETSSTTSSHKVTFRMEPDPPVGGSEANVFVIVTDAAGTVIADAQVRLTLIMPAMPSMNMPEMRSGAELRWNGKEYTGSISVSMAGPWNIVVEASRGGALLGTYRSNTEAR
jgi:hypothetical protein